MEASTTDPVSALNAALAAAQGEFKPIARTATVKTGTYSFSYAPLDAILAAVRPALSKHGLAVTQRLEENNGRPGVRTELRHADGGVVGAFFPLLSEPSSPQQLGSLLTYLRRYAIVALLGVASEEDDDGRAAADAPAAPAKPKAAKMITDAQRTRLFAIAGKHGIEEAALRDIIFGITGDKEGSTKKIPADRYDELIGIITADEVPF